VAAAIPTAAVLVRAAVAAQARAGRIETFNGIYGLNRGLACAFLLGARATAWTHVLHVSPEVPWMVVEALVVTASLSLVRLHRFALSYARKVFAQCLQLATEVRSAVDQDEEAKARALAGIHLPAQPPA
jgi:hypothetical protein